MDGRLRSRGRDVRGLAAEGHDGALGLVAAALAHNDVAIDLAGRVLSAPHGDPATRRLLRPGTGPAATRPIEVAAAVVLGERGGDRVEHELLSPPNAVASLLHCAIYAGPTRTAPTLRAAAVVAERVPVHRARMPDDLGTVRAAARTLFGAGGG